MEVTEPDSARQLGVFAGTSTGRGLLSIVIGLLMASLVIWNFPHDGVRDDLRPEVRPIVNTMAIDQSWGVFAPNPTRTSVAVEADVVLADGTVERYTFPHGDDLVGAYREYRWRKWERRIRLDSSSRMWAPAAHWVARRYADRFPVEVVLLRTFSTTPKAGSGDEREWKTVEFFRLELDGSDGVASAGVG